MFPIAELETLREKWKNLMFKGMFKEAEELYKEKLFSLIQEKFIKEVQMMIDSSEIPKYDLIIIPMGLHWNYAVLLINALKPKYVYFLCTKEAEEQFLDKVIEKTGLSQSEYKKDVVEYAGMDAAEVYGKIKKHLDMFRGKKIAVDLTRGKRAMSAGAAIVGDFFGCDLIYMDEEWIDEIKRGVPGTEKLVLVQNPLYLFGDLEKHFAYELFNRHEYSAAQKLFEELCKKVPDPRDFEVRTLISHGYDLWESLNYKAAFQKLDLAFLKIKQYGITELNLDQLRLNLKVLETLQKAQQSGVDFFEVLKDEKFVIHLLVDIYCNALRRAEQNRFEDALLRFYRLIELVSQHRLAKMNIDTSSPNQLKLNEIEQKFKEVTKQLHGKEKEIPNQIALMDGHIILFSFGDEIWKDKNIKDLMTFLECIKLRDYSIVAHGITLVDRQLYQKFLNNTKELLVKLCNLYNQKFDYLTQQHTPLRLS